MAEKERNYGIELFRSVSMILIVMLHILGQGGVLTYSPKGSAGYQVAWLLETFGFCAVNCYALITGFVNRSTEFRWQRFFQIWVDVVLILLGTNVVFTFFVPGVEVTAVHWLQAFFPLTNKTLWYVNAYALTMPFIPILNRGLLQMEKKQHLTLLAALFILSSCLHIFAGDDNFVLGNGYSAMWLIILYVFGAYFRIHGIPRFLRKAYFTLPAALLSAVIAWWLLMHRDWLDINRALDAGFHNILTRFVTYTSPFMVIMAICLLCFFAGIRVRTRFGKRLYSLLGKTSFGVYVFHVGPVFWSGWMLFRFKGYADLKPPLMALAVIGTAIALYLLFSVVSGAEKLLAFGFDKLTDLLAGKSSGKKSENGKNACPPPETEHPIPTSVSSADPADDPSSPSDF